MGSVEGINHLKKSTVAAHEEAQSLGDFGFTVDYI